MSISEESLSQAELIAGFEGDIARGRVPIVYRAALVLVAFAMVLLPLIYVGLIIATGYGVYYHAVYHVTIFEGEGSAIRLRTLVYVTPIVVGTILVLFMIKPLFARPPRGARPHTLKRADEPTLFAFVDRICQAVRAPAPREIRVDCEANASASFRRRLLSFLGNDLALTIGLPLVSGLSLRQLGGVLAHEFGHFSQGVGMRLTYVIRSVNHWFSRVVYERDSWDLRLDRWAKEIDIRVGVILYLARFFVWLTRRILFALMWVGHAISCFMLRQMEYDADRHETQLVGSKTFESTALRLHLINAASQKAHEDLRHSWTERRLADDVPGLIRVWLDRIPELTTSSVRENLEKGRTDLFDTHPCDADRIRRAARENTEGVFRLEAPATVLFGDYQALCKAVTRGHYRELLGDEADPSTLVSSAQIAADEDARQKASSRVWDYFQGAIGEQRLLFWPKVTDDLGGSDRAELRSQIETARAQMEDHAGQVRANFEEWAAVDARVLDAARATALLDAGFRLPPDAFGVRDSGLDSAVSVWNGARATKKRLDVSLGSFVEAGTRRMNLALSLILQSETSGMSEANPESVRANLTALQALNASAEDLDHLRQELAEISVLVQNLQGHENDERVVNKIRSIARSLWERVCTLWKQLAKTPNPLESPQGAATVADHVIGKSIPEATAIGPLCDTVHGVLVRGYGLYHRILASLVAAALAAENTLGLPPQPNGDVSQTPVSGTASVADQ